MIKRMCKQITSLEQELEGERQKCRKIETDLLQRQNHIITCKKSKPVDRRRTWAPDVVAATITEEPLAAGPLAEEPLAASLVTDLLGVSTIFGHQVEFTENEFNSVVDMSFSNICPAPKEFSTDLLRRSVGDKSKSLLKTPKSFRARRLSENQASPVCTVDRKVYIERLEKELVEFQEFQNIETEQ